MKKFGIFVCVMLSPFLFSLQAQSLPITSWDYTIEAKFINSVFTKNTGDNYNATDTELAWGKPGPSGDGSSQSKLVLDPYTTTGTDDKRVNTYTGNGVAPEGFWADSISLRHENKPIVANSTYLLSTTLLVDVLLKPFTPEYDAFPSQNFQFLIGFEETPNTSDPKKSSDIFTVIEGFPNFNFFFDGDGDKGLNQNGIGDEYYVNVFPVDGVLSKLDNGNLGFTTLENQNTTLPFKFTISSEPFVNTPIPEPATMLLFGVGLIGLAGVSRKKQK